MKNISQEKLNSYSSDKLLDLLRKSFMANALARKDSKLSRTEIKKVQKAIARTLWENFPEVAKEEGLKKVRVSTKSA